MIGAPLTYPHLLSVVKIGGLVPFSTSRLIELIRLEAQEVRAGRHERIRLAAFLFAGCRRLIEEDKSSETGFALRQEQWPYGDALRQLSELDLRLSSAELFGKFLSGLIAIDQSFSQDQKHPHPLHPAITDFSTHLATPDNSDPVLEGIVYHWVNLPSLIRKVRKAGRKMLGPREFLDPVSKNLEYLTIYLHDNRRPALRSLRHDLLPYITQIERSAKLISQNDFRIALCPLIGCWHPRFEIPEGIFPPAFRAIENSIAHSEDLQKHLYGLIRQAAAEEIRILVFPELSLDEPQRVLVEKIIREIPNKLLAIFAGSFHTRDNPKPFNEAVVLDPAGFRYWYHKKNSRYAVPSGTVLDKFFPNQSGLIISEELPEFIQFGDELSFFDTPLGRLATLICTDAIDEHEHSYLPLLLSLRPELIFVLSMSDVTKDFRAFTDRMVRNGMGVLFINAACACRQTADEDLVFLDLAVRQITNTVPVRWRWPATGEAPEWFDNRGHTWVSVKPEEEESRSRGVWRLRQGSDNYGLVLDLAQVLAPLLERLGSR